MKRFHGLAEENQGVVLALAAMLMFCVLDATLKHTLKILDFNQTVFINSVFSITLILGTGLVQKKSFKPQNAKHVFGVMVFNVLEQLCFLSALKYLPFAELFVVILATPMVVLIFSHLFLKEQLHRYQIIAMVFGFFGAMIVAASPLLRDMGAGSGKLQLAPDGMVFGWVCAIANVFFGSCRVCYTRKFASHENSLSMMLSFAVALLIISALRLPDTGWNISVISVLPLLFGCIIGNIGLNMYLKSFKTTRAPLIAATQYSQIIWALLMGYFIFREPLTIVGLIGSALVLLSGYFLYFRKNKEPISSSQT